jgi:transglutaminase-like putative cysteine protease
MSLSPFDMPNIAFARRAAAVLLAFFAAAALASGAAAEGQASSWDGPAFSLAPAASLEAAAELEGKEGDDVAIALESDRYSFDAAGAAVVSFRAVYKILLKKGVERMGSVSCSYQPWRQDRPTIRARVIGADGSVSELDPATISDQSRVEDDDVYSDSRTVAAPLPNLEPGALVEYEIVLRDRAPLISAGGAFRSWFGRSVPIQKRSLIIDYPSALGLRYKVRGPESADLDFGSSSSGGRTSISFSAMDLPGRSELEDYIPEDSVPRTCVDFSTGSSWKDIASAYAAMSEPVIASADVALYAAEALKGLEGAKRAERIAAILYKLRKDVRYTGINFGENAIVPHSPADTIARGYGDCKDQASLLAAALRAAGIDARLALLDAGFGSDLLEALPGFGFFNHAIVYLPEDGAWIDPTATYFRPGELPPMDRGRRALVIAPGSSALSRTPDSAPGSDSYREVRTYNLAESGAASVEETTTATGIIEASYRSDFGSGDPKTIRKNLEKYAKDLYLADKLDDYRIGDVQDLKTGFSLRLSIGKAKRGFTDSSSAVVRLQTGTLLNFLPRFIKDADKAGSEFERVEDVHLDEAYVAEIVFRLIPPPGFRAAALPEPNRRLLGPAFLESSFALQGDGSVTATFRFDCVKADLSPAEAKALHEAAVEFADEEAPTVSFEQVGESLLSAGKYREAFEEFRALAALHPAEALHRIQLSDALIAAGFGEEARAEARKAIALEPSSATAHAQLAWTLIHGPFGRLYEEGCDLAAASAEYGEAYRLAPSEKVYVINRGIIAEYGTDLKRYGEGARLDEALAYYAKAGKALKGTNWEDNPAYDLLRLGRFKELKEATKGPASTKEGKALFLAAVAAVDGTATALREAVRVATAADERREALNQASAMLVCARRYPEAAELMIAGARGSQSQTKALAVAEGLKKARALDPSSKPRTEAEGLIASFILALERWDGRTESIAPFFAASARAALDDPAPLSELAAAFAAAAGSLTGDQEPAAVVADLAMGLGKLDMLESGPATAVLWSFPLDPSRRGQLFYLAREGGALRILDAGDSLLGVAREAFGLLKAGKAEEARAWFAFLRSLHDRNPAFPSLADHPAFKLLGEPASASADDLRLAASYVLASSPYEADEAIGLPALSERLQTADKDLGARLSRLAANALLRLGRYPEAAAMADRLAGFSPYDDESLGFRLTCYDADGQVGRVDRLVAFELEKYPDSAFWLRAAAEHAAKNRRYDEAVRLALALVDSGQAEAGDYNQLAWFALFQDHPSYAAFDDRQIVQRLMAGTAGEVHTLACFLADSGRFLEAQESFRNYLSSGGATDRGGTNAWLAFGLYAQSFGLADTAAEAYGKTSSAGKYWDQGVSSWDLARLRLGKMGGAASAGGGSAAR